MATVTLGPYALSSGISQETADLIAQYVREEWDAVVLNPTVDETYLDLYFYRNDQLAKVWMQKAALAADPALMVAAAERQARRALAPRASWRA